MWLKAQMLKKHKRSETPFLERLLETIPPSHKYEKQKPLALLSSPANVLVTQRVQHRDVFFLELFWFMKCEFL